MRTKFQLVIGVVVPEHCQTCRQRQGSADLGLWIQRYRDHWSAAETVTVTVVGAGVVRVSRKDRCPSADVLAGVVEL